MAKEGTSSSLLGSLIHGTFVAAPLGPPPFVATSLDSINRSFNVRVLEILILGSWCIERWLMNGSAYCGIIPFED